MGLKQKTKKNKKNKINDIDIIESDEYFAYIAGYTENGFAYGITWEQWEEIEAENKNDKDTSLNTVDIDDLPF